MAAAGRLRPALRRRRRPGRAKAMHAVQQPIAGSTFTEAMGVPAWKSLPSWYLIATQDRAIPPAAQRMFASRMAATTSEVPARHVPMVSHPGEAAQLIKTAAETRTAMPAGPVAAHVSEAGPVEFELPDITTGERLTRLVAVLFTSSRGKLLNDTYWSQLWADWREAAGRPKDGTFHSPRHVLATRLMSNGAEPQEVQEALRHANRRITLETYVHWLPKKDRPRGPGRRPPAARRRHAAEASHRSRSNLSCALVVPDDLQSEFLQLRGGLWWAAWDSNPEPKD
ncbi:alpha/beta fold hydrolase [Micromonospora sp. NPDC020750]|uniref:alpha/beta fold hydrolase n=1 Tax=unclassified Micromonospora TaxID=2617518 RepID=UPI00379D1E98